MSERSERIIRLRATRMRVVEPSGRRGEARAEPSGRRGEARAEPSGRRGEARAERSEATA